MTDARLRELERRFEHTRSIEDEAAWLRARVQAGELSEGRVRLAALLEHAAASICVRAWGAPERLRDAQQIAKHLASAGRETLVRGIVSVGRSVVEHYRTAPEIARPEHVTSAASALDAVEDWLLCPCAAHALAAERAGEAVECRLASGHLLLARTAGRAVSADSLRTAQHEVARLAFSMGSLVDLQREVTPWLLGYTDPVRERVERRATPPGVD